MALTNIFREPRREITETAVGIVLMGVGIGLDVCFAFAAKSYTVGTFGPDDDGMPIYVGMLVGLLIIILIIPLGYLTHMVGEGICEALEARGVYLRPRQRP